MREVFLQSRIGLRTHKLLILSSKALPQPLEIIVAHATEEV